MVSLQLGKLQVAAGSPQAQPPPSSSSSAQHQFFSLSSFFTVLSQVADRIKAPSAAGPTPKAASAAGGLSFLDFSGFSRQTLLIRMLVLTNRVES